jgi:hypothetical protein
VAIALLIATNGYWVLADGGLGSGLLGSDDEFEYLELVRLDSTRSDYYQTLRENLCPSDPTYEQGVRFCTDLVRHDLGDTNWPTYDSSYYQATGGHAYQEASEEIDAILDLIGVSDSND